MSVFQKKSYRDVQPPSLSSSCEIWYILPFFHSISIIFEGWGNETQQRDVASPLINPSLSVLEKTHEKPSLPQNALRGRDWKSLFFSPSLSIRVRKLLCLWANNAAPCVDKKKKALFVLLSNARKNRVSFTIGWFYTERRGEKATLTHRVRWSLSGLRRLFREARHITV